jgi:CelD/BcsL family acetyltransferase involved in cellulose biosynthesis
VLLVRFVAMHCHHPGTRLAGPAGPPGDPIEGHAEMSAMEGLEWFVRDDANALAALEPEWQRLVRSMAEPSVFASPEWVRTWWAHFGHGRRLHLAGARRAGELVILAPLCTTRRHGLRVREFLGSEEVDVGGFLVAPGEEALATRLARVVLEQDDWDLLDLWCVAGGSPTAAALDEALPAHGAGHEVLSLTVNPVLAVGTEAWAAAASHSMLKDLARQRRVLGRQGKLEMVFPRDVEGVESALAELRALHRERWKGQREISRLQLADYWGWVRGITLEAWRQGWLYLPRLTLDGRLLATGLYLLHRRRLFYWMGAHDPELARHSPNLLLTLAVIEDLRSAGTADVLDFGRGDEWYKLRWTETSLPLLRVMAWRGLRGRAAHLWHARVRPWAWAHQGVARPVRRCKRAIHRLLTWAAPSP